MAILLDKPFKCFEIIKNILQQSNESEKNEEIKESKGKMDLEAILLKLRDDQISDLIFMILTLELEL